MQKPKLSLLALACLPLYAYSANTLDAHVHGESQLQLALENNSLQIQLRAPGADVVGFEYAPTSAADKQAVAQALVLLEQPAKVMLLPTAAECSLVEAHSHLSGDDEHDEHDHAEHHQDDHHDDHHDEHHGHDEDHHDDHHDEHKDKHHDDHHQNDHHEAHADEHETGAEHSEFHADYEFNCAQAQRLTSIDFVFFANFANAGKIRVTYLTDNAAGTATVDRANPRLTLR